jgi:hypothetical protein
MASIFIFYFLKKKKERKRKENSIFAAAELWIDLHGEDFNFFFFEYNFSVKEAYKSIIEACNQ